MSAASTTTSNTNRVLRSDRTQQVAFQHPVLLGLTILAAGLTAILLFVYLLMALDYRSKPFFGAIVSQTMVIDAGRPVSANVSPWNGLDAGLRHMDHIIAINDVPLSADTADYVTARRNFQTTIEGLSPQSTINVTFTRIIAPGDAIPENCATPVNGLATCNVSYTLQQFPETDFLAYFILPFVSGLIVFGIGLAILRYRPNQRTALLAAVACLLLSIFMAGVFDLGNVRRLTPIWLGASALLGGGLVTLALIFPVPISYIYRWKITRFIPFALSLAIAAFAILNLNTMSVRDFGVPAQIATMTALGGLIVLFVRQIAQRRTASTPTIRDQSNTLIIGIGLVLIPSAIWLVSRVLNGLGGSVVLPFSVESTMPFFITPAASIGYAVLQYRRFDTDKIISRGITYNIMMVALITGYFLLVLGATLLTQNTIRADDPLLIAVTIFIIAILFLPVRTSLQQRIDQVFFRVRRNYQENVEQFGQSLTSLTSYSAIIHEYRRVLDQTIAPSSTFIFLPDRRSTDYVAFGDPRPETDIRFNNESGVILVLRQEDFAVYLEPGQPWPSEMRIDRARLTILRAMVLVGLGGAEQLNGFVCIGPPLSGINRYDFEEIRFVNNLTGQMAIAVERAQVIDSLQRRVRELDVLSQVGQAVNFTIEFNDLLELISAQTNKLIDAPHFYIAMRDPAVNQLYFAFFLEYDERITDKENKRWAIGRDLFSQVISSAQPVRVNEYSKVIDQRDLTGRPEDPNSRAWMGVPLIAGQNTLGVIAVARTTADDPFNDDQLKILGDIGALAATSFNNAQLFAETSRRAQQLSALNDINRQIVATESDVEKMLDIITSSAVQILNAEAGSLLLSADDGSGDMEFKVVVGGSGQELVGSRVKAGHGIVGNVAKTGDPMIVNDAASDPRWEGEVKDDTEWHTNSLLAVPLIAKDNVVGVLEMLNKKDGTIYVDQDVDLLTSFAGQAAIAIENARLLQSTDRELTRRLQELETLDRINHELNRALDLNQVAEITIKWAVANSGASAGALGIVEESPKPQLRIVAKYGYKPEHYPDGTDSLVWPADRGIVSRVMRTRAPDIQTDINIDPDYIPTIPRVNSQITIPMMSGDDLIAILILEKNREPRFNLGDWDFARRLAENASIALTNAQFYAEIQRANKTKSEFMGFAAHELKNPLASVKGYVDVMLSGMTGEVNEKQNEFLRIVNSNARRMQTLIDDLRDIAKFDAQELRVELEPVSMYNITTETLRPFQQQLQEKEQTVVNNVGEDLPEVHGDQNRLIQVMTNLVSNASKYSPPGATITLSAEPKTTFITKDNERFENVLLVSVADTGIGMDEKDLARIFKEEYFRSDNDVAREMAEGTGLGMMITHLLIELHQGRIWVDSEINVGTTFSFIVPLATEKQTTPSEPATEPASD